MTNCAMTQGAAPMFFDRNDMDRNVFCLRIVFQTIEDRPAVAIRQANVESDPDGIKFVRERQGHLPRRRDQPPESLFARLIQENSRERYVIFNNQNAAVALFNVVPVVDNWGWLTAVCPEHVPGNALCGSPGCLNLRERFRRPGRYWIYAAARRHVIPGQVKRERAAFAGRAVDANFAAQQTRDFAANRKAQARAAVLTARGAVSLLEGFEDNSLLVFRNTDACIGNRECDYVTRAIQRFEIILLPWRRRFDPQHDISFFSKFEGVRQEIHQNLLQTLLVGDQSWFEIATALD